MILVLQLRAERAMGLKAHVTKASGFCDILIDLET